MKPFTNEEIKALRLEIENVDLNLTVGNNVDLYWAIRGLRDVVNTLVDHLEVEED